MGQYRESGPFYVPVREGGGVSRYRIIKMCSHVTVLKQSRDAGIAAMRVAPRGT